LGRKSPKTKWIPKQLILHLVHSAPHLIYLPALFILLFSIDIAVLNVVMPTIRTARRYTVCSVECADRQREDALSDGLADGSMGARSAPIAIVT
jgi:hypothetical protein